MAAISQRFLGRAIDWSSLFFPSFLQAASRPFSPFPSFWLRTASNLGFERNLLSKGFTLFPMHFPTQPCAPIYVLRKGDRRELSFGWRAQSHLLRYPWSFLFPSCKSRRSFDDPVIGKVCHSPPPLFPLWFTWGSSSKLIWPESRCLQENPPFWLHSNVWKRNEENVCIHFLY